MTLEQVIQAGEKFQIPMNIPPIYIAGAVTLLIMAFVFFWCSIYQFEAILFAMMFGAGAWGIFVLGQGHILGKEDPEYIKSLNTWKTEYVQPYLKTLPTEKKEIIYVKMDTSLLLKESAIVYLNILERTPLVVSYKDDNEVITKKDWFSLHMDLGKEGNPYITYQTVPKDLGHGLDAGIYNANVYLPESYSFMEIK